MTDVYQTIRLSIIIFTPIFESIMMDNNMGLTLQKQGIFKVNGISSEYYMVLRSSQIQHL